MHLPRAVNDIALVSQLCYPAVDSRSPQWCGGGVQVVERAMQAPQPLQMRQELPNPNRRRLWLLPLLIAAQVAAKVLLLDRIIESDACRGDKNGEYDPETQRWGSSAAFELLHLLLYLEQNLFRCNGEIYAAGGEALTALHVIELKTSAFIRTAKQNISAKYSITAHHMQLCEASVQYPLGHGVIPHIEKRPSAHSRCTTCLLPVPRLIRIHGSL